MSRQHNAHRPGPGLLPYRVRFTYDPEAVFENSHGRPGPETEEEYTANEFIKDGRKVTYAEYLEYYGNPDRHVFLRCEVDKYCSCCGSWTYETGLHGIDFMDDAPELNQTDVWHDPIEAERFTGYLREVALDCLSEAGYKLPRHLFCRVKGCTYRHTRDSYYCDQHQKTEPPRGSDAALDANNRRKAKRTP